MIDAHCHLDAVEGFELAERRAPGRGWVCAGFSPERWPAQRAIAGDDVWHAFGLHPWACAEGWSVEQLRSELDRGAVAVGECGLDFARSRDHDGQERILAEHLSLARERDLPVVLHLVRCHAAALRLLDTFPGVRGMVHAFAGPIEQAGDFLERGLYLSVGPFSLRRPEVLAALPPERVLVETDAPGRGAHLRDLETVLEALAAAAGGTARDWAERSDRNLRRLLDLERKLT